jgi:hypothetical protein
MDTNSKPNVCCVSTPSVLFGTAKVATDRASDKSWGADLAAKDAQNNR